ncbi:MAG: extracellular solute-binding protein [Lachnospiraceae bacterium]|nr:extracellular solute-binding protein [Lachnospiraceae bacterium]
MKLWKRALGIGLCGALSASLLAGCSADFGSSDSADSEAGSYVETDYGVPALEGDAADEDSRGYMEAMTFLPEENLVRVLMSDDSDLGHSVLDSADGGRTWTESAFDISALESVVIKYDAADGDENSGKYGYLSQAAFDSEGDLFFTYVASEWTMSGDTEIVDSTTSYYLLTADGVLTEIHMEIPDIPSTSHEEYIAEESSESDVTPADEGAAFSDADEVDSETSDEGKTEADSVTSDEDDAETGTDSSDEGETETGTDSSDEGETEIGTDSSDEVSDDDSVTISSGSAEDDEEEYNDINSLLLRDSENLYVQDLNGSIIHISLSDGSVAGMINDFDWINWMMLSGDRLLVFATDSVCEYDTGTDKQTAKHEALYDIFDSNSSFTAVGSVEDDAVIYYACMDGIFSYDLDTDTAAQVMDGNATSLNSANCGMDYFMETNDGSFLVWHTDYLTDTMESTLLNFSYSADAVADYTAELTIYVLANDNYSLDTMVSLYKKEHPDVKVTIEYGYSDDDAATASDALRTLNTEIMAGNGPDLILLDGMDVDTYVENGLLLDLSETVQPMIDSGALFPNIAGTYTEDDGAIYAVPLTFSVPALVGETEIVNEINSLSDYAAAVEAYAASEESADIPFMESYDLMDLIGTMMFVNAGTWFAEDETLDEENLTEYLTEMKKLYRAVYATLPEDDREYYDEEISSYLEDMGDTSSISDFGWIDPAGEVMSIMVGSSKIELGNLSYDNGLEYITSAQRAGEDITWKLMPGTMENVYVPSMTIGINSKSEQQEAAVVLLSYLLSDDGQEDALNYTDGYPVNTSAFDAMMTDPNLDQEGYEPGTSTASMGIVEEDGRETDLDLYWPSDEQIEEFKGIINGLDTPAYTNDTVLTTILTDCYACVTGDEVSVEDAIAQVVQDLSIYLAE